MCESVIPRYVYVYNNARIMVVKTNEGREVQGTNRRARILVVEDEAIVARDIAEQLEALGYQAIGVASNGEAALQLARAQRPDLVLMDIQIDGALDGIAVAELLRTQQQIPVVFLTAYSSEEFLQRAQLTEPFGYILKPFSERELGTTLSMALYKHQAEERLQATTRQLKALSQRVLEVQEQERRRVAVELHDELGQLLTAIKINLQLSERLKEPQPLAELQRETIGIVEDAIQQVRRLATTLRPSMLDDLGLAPALQWLCEQSAGRAGLRLRFHHVRNQPRLASDIETACFRIVQEAMTNITRHAQASGVDVTLEYVDGQLRLRIRDDGCGFALDDTVRRAQGGSSLGVLGMQERATLIGGSLHIQTQPGQGSTVELVCPWRAQEEPA